MATLRDFSKYQHAKGVWDSRKVYAKSAVVKSIIKVFSFKRNGVSRLSKNKNKTSRVLDAGAGKGAYTHWFLQQCPCTIYAVDWVFESLITIPKSQNGTVIRICADLQHLPIKSGCLDAAFSIDTIGHLEEKSKAISELARVTKIKSSLFIHSEISDYQRKWPDAMLIKKSGYDIIASIDGHHNLLSCSEMEQLCSQYFKIVSCVSPAGLMGWLIGYPEKYSIAFNKAHCVFWGYMVELCAKLKKITCLKLLLHCINIITNRIEILCRMGGGGSCFLMLEKVEAKCGTKESS